MAEKVTGNIYSEEISLTADAEYQDYVQLNLRKIKEFRQGFQVPVIGIAGTEGKTTTKLMLASILSQRGPILETPLDCDSASDITSTILKLNKQHKYVLIELGLINRDQFKMAVDVSLPTIGLITTIGESHLAGLGDKYSIADTNVELIRRLPPNGFASLNIDDELVSGMDALSPTPQVVKFGFNVNAHFYASHIQYLGPEGMEFFVNDYYKFHLPIYGSTSISNALAAVSIARVLGLEYDEIKTGLENNFKLLPGRGNLIDLKDVYILDYTYNATLNAVTKACESLVQFKNFSKNLVLVLGNLESVGKSVENIHLNLGYYISALPINVVITVGDNAKFVGEGIRRINHNRKVISHVAEPESLPQTILDYLTPHTTLLMMGEKSLNLKGQLKKLIEQIQG
ncbi:MAG: hypothetical protein Kow0042_02800 [Calditrichia bacterium]